MARRPCGCVTGLLSDFACWVEILKTLPQRPYFLSHHPCTSGFWKGLVQDSDSEIDANHVTAAGIPVFTTDASGPRGGGRFMQHRFSFLFSEEDQRRSTNWRELSTSAYALNLWGPALASMGSRVLVRSDNIAAVAAFNRSYSGSEDLNILVQQVSSLATAHGIVLAARHIPGIQNKLADALSRWRPESAASNCQLLPSLFDAVQQAVGSHQVDACAEPGGGDSFYPVFWSPVHSSIEEDWAAKRVWCHPPVGLVDGCLQRFRQAYAARPAITSATFVLPAWPYSRMWKYLKGGRLLHHCPAANCRLNDAVASLPVLSGTSEDVLLLRGMCSASVPEVPRASRADYHQAPCLPQL